MIRSYLFLQGVSSPFFSALGRRLSSDGHRVSKINFTGGDSFYWKERGAINFRGLAINLPQFYESLFERIDHCTDIIMFGDCRPVHAAVIDSARRRGKRIHVFEEGYFRPYWITLERDGVNGASRLPRDPDWFRTVGKRLPHYHNGRSFKSSFAARAWHDVQYHIWSALNPVLYPGYRTHAPFGAPREYAGYVKRALWHGKNVRLDSMKIDSLVRSGSPFFFLPLQLDSDAQIRSHSSFKGMSEVIALVMKSFSLHAPGEAILVIKNHPLDPGIVAYKRLIKKLESIFDVQGRVIYLETGHLPTLLDLAAGVVTVNSTVGGSALIHRRPTIALANPIYAIPGLTFQGSLDEFWMNGDPPDMSLFRCFRNTVIHTTQVNGGFYSKEGINLAIDHSLSSLYSEKSALERLL